MSTNSYYNKVEDTKTDITHGKVKNSVQDIETSSKNMGQMFTDFRNTMSEVYQEDNFSGEASDSLQEKFDSFQKKFDSYTDAVERFAKAIEGAREATEQTEKQIQNRAEALKH